MSEQEIARPLRAMCPACGHDHQERPTAQCDADILLSNAHAVIAYQERRDPTKTAKLLMTGDGHAIILFYEEGRTSYPRVGGPLDWAISYLAFEGMQPVSEQASNHQKGLPDVRP